MSSFCPNIMINRPLMSHNSLKYLTECIVKIIEIGGVEFDYFWKNLIFCTVFVASIYFCPIQMPL